MNEFLENLKREASENPTVALAVAAGLLTAASKFIDAAGRHKGSAAFAKDVDRRIREAAKK
jgi:hypothetical protein